MREQKLLVFGAGTAGVGIADQLHDAMVRDGATKRDGRPMHHRESVVI
jgi:malate dehydrogenase (oxaloacetate-decarboxylating)